ncbi:MAG TPA: 2Fe-2S iron-sulfur cluster-binding protein [Terriglobales bacterium]|nr:2Fe-2S iron-sulfur cluster-binding protein [Terriglobales bacterium]
MSHYHSLRMAEVRPETREAITVTFDIPSPLAEAFRFTPGQHVNVRADVAGQEVRRSYSICAAASQQLRILIKRQPGGLFSNWANDQLHTGGVLDVMPPTGLFHLPKAAIPGARYLAIAAGSGITPVLSILKSSLAADPHCEWTLFYGNRASSTILFREELADLKDRYLERFSLVHVMSREEQDLDLLNGRLTPDRCLELLRHWGPLQGLEAVFLCGPHEMNREVADALLVAGYPAARIKREQFATSRQQQTLAPLPPAGENAVCQAQLILDGRTHQFPVRQRETILDAGLRAGIDLRFSCKGGVCATCRAKLVSGEVDMDGNFALEDYEIARGYILTCQSYPVSPALVVDFDQD